MFYQEQKILDALWGYDYYGDGRAVDTYIKRLRKRLENYSYYIQTVVKIGYIWKGEESCKKIRSIQFKVFICLFISFMVVFGYVVKNKYDRSFNELVYNTDYTASDDYINFCNTIDSRGPHQVELDLEKIKK